MIAKSNISLAGRIFSLLLSLYVLNFSVDIRDAHPADIADDIEYNEIESFVEFMLEIVLGIDNAVAEYDEKEKDDGVGVHFQFFFSREFIFDLTGKCSPIVSSYFPRNYDLNQENFPEIQSPPPKV